MKVTKTVKYNYKLTEETLEKDIEQFIKEAEEGKYDRYSKHREEIVRIIKQYLKLVNKLYYGEEYAEAKECYKKLIIFLIKASIHEDVDFGYEDLLSKVDKEFSILVRNYLNCLIKICDIKELTEAIVEFAIYREKGGYGFDDDIRTLINGLNEQTFHNLEQRMLVKTEGMTKKEQDKIDIIYFLLEVAGEQNNKEKYLSLCERLRGVIPDKEMDYLVKEFNEEYPETEVL